MSLKLMEHITRTSRNPARRVRTVDLLDSSWLLSARSVILVNTVQRLAPSLQLVFAILVSTVSMTLYREAILDQRLLNHLPRLPQMTICQLTQLLEDPVQSVAIAKQALFKPRHVLEVFTTTEIQLSLTLVSRLYSAVLSAHLARIAQALPPPQLVSRRQLATARLASTAMPSRPYRTSIQHHLDIILVWELHNQLHVK